MVQELLQVPGLHYVYSGRTWEWAEQEAYPREFAHPSHQPTNPYPISNL